MKRKNWQRFSAQPPSRLQKTMSCPLSYRGKVNLLTSTISLKQILQSSSDLSLWVPFQCLWTGRWALSYAESEKCTIDRLAWKTITTRVLTGDRPGMRRVFSLGMVRAEQNCPGYKCNETCLASTLWRPCLWDAILSWRWGKPLFLSREFKMVELCVHTSWKSTALRRTEPHLILSSRRGTTWKFLL